MKLEDVLGNESSPRKLLGEMLIRRGQVRRYQLDFALRLQEAYRKIQRNERLGEIFIEHRVLSDRAIQEALKFQSEMPADSLTDVIKDLDEKIDTLSIHTQVLVE